MEVVLSQRATILLAIVLLCLSATSQATCPSQKANRKRQEQRLATLNDKHIVAESTYIGELDETYSFLVERVWESNNGSLKRLDEISVSASAGGLDDCFGRLRVRENYILMMVEVDRPQRTYRAVEAPVSSHRRKHRQAVWNKLCAKVEGDPATCSMRVTLPPTTIFYRGSMKILQCKVESSSTVTDVTWFKDNANIDTADHRRAGLYVDTSNRENSFIMIRSASAMHNGDYRCSARNAEGQVAHGETTVIVIGPTMDSHFTTCKDPQYCMNNGKCRQFIDQAAPPLCECQSGYEGDRCQETSNDITASSVSDDELENMRQNVSQLTTAVAVVTVALVFVLVVAAFYISRLRRRLSPDKDNYNVVDQCCAESRSTNSEIQTTRYTSTGTDATTIRMSMADGVGAPDSRRSSAITPSRKSSRLQSLVVSENEKPSPRSSHSSFKDYEPTTPLTDNVSHSSGASNGSRRGRLTAKS